MSNHEYHNYRTGKQLLAGFPHIRTREQKLEQACKALMQVVDELHLKTEDQSLEDNLDNQNIFCSCADAYRMGHEALKA